MLHGDPWWSLCCPLGVHAAWRPTGDLQWCPVGSMLHGVMPFGGPCCIPVVQRSPRVLAAADLDHEQREEQEEHGHAEAGAVHRLVAHQHGTVHVALHPRQR